MNNVVIVIPSLDPDERLINLLISIRKKETDKISIILIDDGSSAEYAHFFNEAKKKYGAIILRHKENMGKGAAIKTAIKYFLKEMPDKDGIVTIDSDGQHRFDDVVNCVNVFNGNPGSLVLGVRKFGKEVPFRSRFGNELTSKLLRIFSGISISDTQTGLRVIPRGFCSLLLKTNGERFEFEMNMLYSAREHNIPITEKSISTVYLDGNKSSHFRVIHDSLLIYSSFIRFSLSSLFSFLIDVGIFAFFMFSYSSRSFLTITIASFLARFCSSVFNYLINQKIVFDGKSSHSISKYYLLVVFQVFISSYFVTFLHNISDFNTVFIKIIVDFILFFFSFYVQKRLIFRGE
ncbi:MAG: bifunctional glycosyltransferase family 2/GtrA family protein [Oenococcus oeni]